jgi:hypothetical protein
MLSTTTTPTPVLYKKIATPFMRLANLEEWIDGATPDMQNPGVNLFLLQTIIPSTIDQLRDMGTKFIYKGLMFLIENTNPTAPTVVYPYDPHTAIGADRNPYRVTHPHEFNYKLTVQELSGTVIVQAELDISPIGEPHHASAAIKCLRKGATMSGKSVLGAVLRVLDLIGCKETVLYDRAETELIIKGRHCKIPISLMMTIEGIGGYYTHATTENPSQFMPCWGEHYTPQIVEGKPEIQQFIQHPYLYQWAVQTIQTIPVRDIIRCYPKSATAFTYLSDEQRSTLTLKECVQLLRQQKSAGHISPQAHLKRIANIFHIFFNGKKIVHDNPLDMCDRTFLLAWNIVYNTTVFHRVHPRHNHVIHQAAIPSAFNTPSRINLEAPLADQIVLFLKSQNPRASRFQDCLYTQSDLLAQPEDPNRKRKHSDSGSML